MWLQHFFVYSCLLWTACPNMVREFLARRHGDCAFLGGSRRCVQSRTVLREAPDPAGADQGLKEWMQGFARIRPHIKGQFAGHKGIDGDFKFFTLDSLRVIRYHQGGRGKAPGSSLTGGIAFAVVGLALSRFFTTSCP